MKKKIIIILIFLLTISLTQKQINNLFPKLDSVTFLKVGQGDAVLLQSERGARILVDGGPDNSVIYRLGDYLPLFDLSLDGIFITHTDLDHVLGVIEVLRRYHVQYLFITEVLSDKYLGELAVTEAAKHNIKIVFVDAGDVIHLSGLDLTVLWPDKNLINLNTADTNDTSIVLRADWANGSAILTGDASVEIEEILIKKYGTANNVTSTNKFNCTGNRQVCSQLEIHSNVLDVDVLKAGHHGSRSATSPEFVEATSPIIGAISAGLDNKFGHPHQDVLDILANYNVKILDNLYQDLQIEFTSNGLLID